MMKPKGTSMLPLATTGIPPDSLKDHKSNNHSTVELYFGILFGGIIIPIIIV